MKNKQPPSPAASNDESGDSSEYSVGYCRPPLHSRFKPGKSGNPKGRPRAQKNGTTILNTFLNERVTLREGRVMSKFEALILNLLNRALTNDHKAFANLFVLLRATGHFNEELPSESNLLPPEQAEAMVRDYVERNPLPLPQPRRAGQAKLGRRR